MSVEHKKKRSIINKIWRFLWITAVSLILFSWIMVFVYRWIMPPLTPLMVARFNQQVFQKGREVNFERNYVSIDAIDSDLVDAVVASEDNTFIHHHGFDVTQLKKSYVDNMRGRHIRGGSTISMQTAKNAFLPHRRSMLRKVCEAYFTQLIEWWWGKKRIMEVYLNIIEFGDGIYGCEAAAQHYFGHSAAMLSRHEAAELAATLPSPLKRNPENQTAYFQQQTSIIQGRIVKYGTVAIDNAATIRRADRKSGQYTETLIDFMKWYIDTKRK